MPGCFEKSFKVVISADFENLLVKRERNGL